MAGDDRPVPYLVGAARTIRTCEPVHGIRPWDTEESRHHHVDGRWRRGVGWPVQHQRPDPRPSRVVVVQAGSSRRQPRIHLRARFPRRRERCNESCTTKRRLPAPVQQHRPLPDRGVQPSECARAADALSRRLRSGFVDDQPAVDAEHRRPRPSATAGGSRRNVNGSARSSRPFPRIATRKFSRTFSIPSRHACILPST